MSTVRESGPPPIGTWPSRACEGAETDLFFPSTDSGRPKAAAEVQARALCSRCLAREECEAYAVPVVDLFGIWAGMSANQREQERKRRKKEA